jgi:hypothetical protein
MIIFRKAHAIFRPLNLSLSLLIVLLCTQCMLVQGGADTVVPPENTRTWSDAMKEMAMKYEYMELPNGDHGTVISDGMPNIFNFFADHSEASHQ